MDNQDPAMDSRSNKLRPVLVLLGRWLLGGLAGFWISAWIGQGYLSNNTTGLLKLILDSTSLVAVLFMGQVLLFDPSFFGKKWFIDWLAYSFPNAERNFLIVLVPSLIWGLVGLLLASGRNEQKKMGIILLIIYVIVGCISLTQLFVHIPN